MVFFLAGPAGTAGAASLATGAAFLKIGGGARPTAMGGAYTAAAGDVDSLYYNPGGLSAIGKKELSFTHTEWLQGMSYDVVEYGHPTGVGTWGASLSRLGSGTLEGRDAQRHQTSNFSAEDFAGSVAFGRNFGPGLGLGVNAKYIQSRIDTSQASSVAVDAGALGRWPGRPLWFGLSVLNFGPGLRFIDQTDPLPLTVAAGVAAEPIGHLKLDLDFKEEPHDDRTELSLGGEYSPVSPLALRMGYTAPLNGIGDEGLSTLQNLRGGVGLKVSKFRLDYAVMPFANLGLTHRISLSVSF